MTIDDDVFETAARQAKLRGVSIRKSVSDLMRRALHTPTPTREEKGVGVFALPEDSPHITTADVRRIEAEGA